MKRIAVGVCAVMLLAGCAAPLNAETSAKMSKYMELCEANGGEASYHAAGNVHCKWDLNKEES